MSEPENGRGTRNTNTRDTNPNQTPQSPPSTQPSLARRVQSSASGLARTAFSAQDPSAAQTLANATNGKASAGPASTGGTGSQVLGSSSSSVSGSGSGTTSTQSVREAFRQNQNQNEGPQGGFALPALSEDEFQHEQGFFEDSVQSCGSLQSDGGSWKGKARARDPVQGEYSTAWERANATTAQPEADGAAVVSLLSDSSFDAGFVGNEDLETVELDVDPDAAPPPLTGEEIKFLDSFRRQTGIDTSGQSEPAKLSSYSLVPDIDVFLQQNDSAGYVQAKGESVSNSTVSLRDDVLSNLPGAGDWIGVHERYHDEVWGYLRPALEAAKEEMEQYHGQEHEDGDGPAVRRLKMILKHMKA